MTSFWLKWQAWTLSESCRGSLTRLSLAVTATQAYASTPLKPISCMEAGSHSLTSAGRGRNQTGVSLLGQKMPLVQGAIDKLCTKRQRGHPSHQASQASCRSACWLLACLHWCLSQSWWICSESRGFLWSGKHSMSLSMGVHTLAHKASCLLRCPIGRFETHRQPRSCAFGLWPNWEMCCRLAS